MQHPYNHTLALVAVCSTRRTPNSTPAHQHRAGTITPPTRTLSSLIVNIILLHYLAPFSPYFPSTMSRVRPPPPPAAVPALLSPLLLMLASPALQGQFLREYKLVIVGGGGASLAPPSVTVSLIRIRRLLSRASASSRLRSSLFSLTLYVNLPFTHAYIHACRHMSCLD